MKHLPLFEALPRRLVILSERRSRQNAMRLNRAWKKGNAALTPHQIKQHRVWRCVILRIDRDGYRLCYPPYNDYLGTGPFDSKEKALSWFERGGR